MIKLGTFPISPTEIEQVLLTHKSVTEVAVIGVKQDSETQWPRAYVKVKDGKSVTLLLFSLKNSYFMSFTALINQI